MYSKTVTRLSEDLDEQAFGAVSRFQNPSTAELTHAGAKDPLGYDDAYSILKLLKEYEGSKIIIEEGRVVR